MAKKTGYLYVDKTIELQGRIGAYTEHQVNERLKFLDKSKFAYNMWEIMEIGLLADRARELGINQ